MGSTYFLSCKCGSHDVRLSRFSHEMLVSDMTGFFERIDPAVHGMGWGVFADGCFDNSRDITDELLMAWITGIRRALRDRADEVPILYRIFKPASGEDACAYLKIEHSFWMVEAVGDELVASPIAATVVAERESDPDYGVVIVAGSRSLFPGVDPDQARKFHPTESQISSVLKGTALALIAKPIGSFFASEIAAIAALADHAHELGEHIESYCI